MITSIRKLLQKHEIPMGESVYQEFDERELDYLITIGDFVEAANAEKMSDDFYLLEKERNIENEIFWNCPEYKENEERTREINKKLKMKSSKSTEEMSEEEEAGLRAERKQLAARKKELTKELLLETKQRLGYVWQEQKGLRYKSTVFLSGYRDLKKKLPILSKLDLEHMEGLPLFVSNIHLLTKALEEQKEIGIVGGPCLFGMDEVFLHIYLNDNTGVDFDCSCGRRCLNETKTEDTLEEYIFRHRKEIRSIKIENRKTGVTRQEYDSILYVFAFADLLKAKVVIPLPDISYLKYMESDLSGLDEAYRREIMASFQTECHILTDYYLGVIETIAESYPKVEYQVLHERNKELCSLFYEKRAPFLQKSSYIQKLTNVSGRKDAVIDYITMLALPYYVYGISNILQLDSVDETDSGRKCKKIHKKEISLSQILYPEYLSRDGKHTIYYAPQEYKDYLEQETFKKE